ncbi:MAG: hypothetical protein AMK72_07325 [Planctomycetes bacterium SM23_25]|nr:MAG: hypothetical protein AMK72_07325 [Planctomycetes bacterium SM23_25]
MEIPGPKRDKAGTRRPTGPDVESTCRQEECTKTAPALAENGAVRAQPGARRKTRDGFERKEMVEAVGIEPTSGCL